MIAIPITTHPVNTQTVLLEAVFFNMRVIIFRDRFSMSSEQNDQNYDPFIQHALTHTYFIQVVVHFLNLLRLSLNF